MKYELKSCIVIFFFSGICMSLLPGCMDKRGSVAPADKEATPAEVHQNAKSGFKLPDIPITIVSEEERMKYIVGHYWDEYDFADTLLIRTQDIAEQILVDYLALLNVVSEEDAKISLQKLVGNMDRDVTVCAWFMDKLEHYLYDPNSPMRNDVFYVSIVEKLLTSKTMPEITLERPKYQLKMLKTNKVGAKATDFTFRMASGKTASLVGVHSKLTLLLLYNPDCENCQKTIDLLANSPILEQLCQSMEGNISLLTVLSVSTEGTEETWKLHLPTLPVGWLNGYDEKAAISTNELYDLRSVPSIYLLDEDKRVILRDVDASDVLKYIVSIQ